MIWNGTIGLPCSICGMDRSTDNAICYDCALHASYEAKDGGATRDTISRLNLCLVNLHAQVGKEKGGS